MQPSPMSGLEEIGDGRGLVLATEFVKTVL